LKTASGALDSRKGQVLFEGREIQCKDPDWVARQGIAHVPEGREVFPFLTVSENLAMGAYNRDDSSAIASDVEAVFDYFPALRTLSDHLACYLSGGQQQMLAIARGFMARPKLLLLDEPSLGLSPVLVSEIFEIITRLNREHGLTILLVEQNANVALQVSARGYVMEVGGMVMDGASDQLLESEDIKEFYLGKKDEGIRGRRRWKKRKTWR
jgi:branched-chain amino acid transport system ATP-binding protein